MTYTSEHQSAADIQRDIDEDRRRIEERIDVIQDRMSPGQLIDEVIGYVKNSGGGEYAANLGNAVKTNPIPLALMGVSMAWLMAGAGSGSSVEYDEPPRSRSRSREYPLATVSGEIRRVDPSTPDDSYTHFMDDAGKRYRAMADSTGKRAGPFLDEAGTAYSGFVDAAGNRISSIKDQAGAIWDGATDWLSDTFHQVSDAAVDVTDTMAAKARSLGDASASAGAGLRDQTARLNQTILTHFRDQPLVGGALAFAVGAAIGAALPHTETEDAVVGDAAQNVRDSVVEKAEELLDEGKAEASELYDQAVEVADEVYDAASERLRDTTNRPGS
ncbi:DUF3618 domain-containing protein [Phyllobacterium endophyticum]|uniref:DUF3618 domain-containing protein n=1 Tax=Phyllobacterium endophyticum TaxID=1149773 RepID=UPI0011C80ED2|nr:DUF3618 domain-containing protein [Phyllobacterium endophyticum]TXR48273.1 DUF3618 domain-containing protein [Phyllobacterium endophyticum]